MTIPPNHLIHESSTYLLQHAFNPVNWHAWTKEALVAAVSKDKPILLSIGYSACHWCHVMEEESFQDNETAQLINDNFIPIKVDREERPDIDDIYMTAVQLMTGHGGWPLTVFLTPEQKPFFGGTYFPKEDTFHGQHVLPGFKTILKAVSQAWQDRREEAEAGAAHLTGAIKSITDQLSKNPSRSHKPIDSDLLINCTKKILPMFDTIWGGFKGAPKFPQTLVLELCLQAALYTKNKDKIESELFLDAVSSSLNGMANGGIYDHLGGGFARYSTDEKWLVPHFEKMLYDNALLVGIYLDSFTYTGQIKWLNVACETLEFLTRELAKEDGGFYSALDADSEGVEGKFYVWEKAEITKTLGSDTELFCKHFGVTESGNFEHNNILHLSNILEDEKEKEKILDSKKKLLAKRSDRIRPTRDDKMLTSWNGLAISAFAHGYRISGNENYLKQAQKTAQFVLTKLADNQKLKRSFAKETAKLSGYLDDYAFFCQALIDLAGIDSNPIWLSQALSLTDTMIKYFFSEETGDFYYTASDEEELITRPKNFYDGPIPSATSVAISCLLKMELLTNNKLYRQVAQTSLEKHQDLFYSHPTQYANMIRAWDFSQGMPLSLVLVTSGNPIMDKDMLLNLYRVYNPNMIVIVKDNSHPKELDSKFTLLQQKNTLDGKPTLYICQEQSCQTPINDIDKVKVMLKNC